MKRLSVVLVMAAMLVVLAAVPASAQTSKLLVTDVSPDGGSANVGVNSNISATFNIRMDRSTINNKTFYLKQQGSTVVVPAQVTYAGTTKTATLNPDANLASGATYTAYVKGGRTGVKSAGGRTLGGTTDATATFANAKVSWTFTVSTPPNTTIDSGPSGTVASNSASFGFSSSKANSSFQCSLDAAPFTSCTSPKSYPGLADGSHTFRVRAIDNLGNVDPTAARRTWTVDTTGPDATITSGPTKIADPPSVSFTFSGAEPGGGYRCNFDGPGPSVDVVSACSSGDSFPVGADGTYTFSVWASDALGNFGKAASRTWMVDTVAPATPSVSLDASSDSGVKNDNKTNDITPTISGAAEFASTVKIYDAQNEVVDSTTSFGTWSYTFVDDLRPDGNYSYTVKATDPAGNESQGTSITLTIDTAAPDTTIGDKPANPANSASATFTFSSSESGSTFGCSLDIDFFTTNCTSPKSYSDLAEGSHTFKVRATDAAGNVDPTPASHTWTVEAKAPTVTFTPEDTTDVAPNTNVKATFSEAMDEASVEAQGTFTLKAEGSSTAVEATVTSFGKSAILDPSTDLALNTTYTATLTTEAKDLAGNALAEVGSWTFKTANAPRNVTVTPTTLDFGTITGVGLFGSCPSVPPLTLTVTNNSSYDVTYGAVSITQTPSGRSFSTGLEKIIREHGSATQPAGFHFFDEVAIVASGRQTYSGTLTYLDDTGAPIGNPVTLKAQSECIVVG